jgi:hypothetical protein
LNPNKKYLNRDQAFTDILDGKLEIPKHTIRSKELVDLVTNMLEKEPSKRISFE